MGRKTRDGVITSPGEGVGEATEPSCSPPSLDYVLFTETARTVVRCVEINHRHGTFIGPTRTRVSALAIVEAFLPNEESCGVRLVGRVVGKEAHPVPTIRVRWIRAISEHPVSQMLSILGECYGLYVSTKSAQLPPKESKAGYEYLFDNQQLIPRTLDEARRDSSGPVARYSSQQMARFAPPFVIEPVDEGTTTVSGIPAKKVREALKSDEGSDQN